MGLWDHSGLADTLTGVAPGLGAQWGVGRGVLLKPKGFGSITSRQCAPELVETAPDFFQTPPHHPAPHPEKCPSLHTPQQIVNGKKKVVLKLSSPPLLSIPAFPRALDRVDSSGACLWKEGRAMGVLAASLGCWEELDHLVRASWSGSGAPAPCPANPFRLR